MKKQLKTLDVTNGNLVNLYGNGLFRKGHYAFSLENFKQALESYKLVKGYLPDVVYMNLTQINFYKKLLIKAKFPLKICDIKIDLK